MSVKIDRTGSPLAESKAAPYPVQAPRIVTDATTVGQTVEIGLKFNAAVAVSGGTPQLSSSIGGNPRSAALASGSGSDDLIFAYTLQAGDA
ncbi:MAG: hypothetical protein KDA58_13650, partial [Planctomycetaceae bacterium]|nr:hypothetical protein [Planctomycetaceae bacterium]